VDYKYALISGRVQSVLSGSNYLFVDYYKYDRFFQVEEYLQRLGLVLQLLFKDGQNLSAPILTVFKNVEEEEYMLNSIDEHPTILWFDQSLTDEDKIEISSGVYKEFQPVGLKTHKDYEWSLFLNYDDRPFFINKLNKLFRYPTVEEHDQILKLLNKGFRLFNKIK